MSTDLEIQPAPAGLWKTDDYGGIIAQAANAARELATVIKQQRLTVKISGRDHVLVEGWTLLGTLLGVQPYVVWTRPLGTDEQIHGWEARVEARTLDGRVVSAAEAQCTRGERTWRARDDYALRSMAQTRAVSKALRLPLGFVMSLAGFEATPAEEMPPHADIRTRIVLGPEVDPLETDDERDDPRADFDPVTDPGLEQIDEPPQDRIYQNEPIGSSFRAPPLRESHTDAQPLTEPQRKKIYALISKLRKHNPDTYSDDKVKLQLGMQYGTEAVAELTRHQARDLIDRLVAKEQELNA